MVNHWKDVLSLTLPYALGALDPVVGIAAAQVINAVKAVNDITGLYADGLQLVTDLYNGHHSDLLGDSEKLGVDGVSFVWGRLTLAQKFAVIGASAGWFGLDAYSAGASQEIADDIDAGLFVGQFSVQYFSWLHDWSQYYHSS